MPNPLNLFPARVPIGRVTDDAGRSFDVVMTPEFSRALSDLLVRVGGSNGMGNADLAALSVSGAEIGQVLALQAELAELRALVDAAGPVLTVLRQLEQMRAELAMIEDPAAAVRYILTRFARLESPTFTGIPTAPTAAVDTKTKQLATTEFVIGQAGDVAPTMNGGAVAGESRRYARADHVHPTDTSRQASINPGAVTGSRAGNTAVTLSLLSALAASGLITNNTTA